MQIAAQMYTLRDYVKTKAGLIESLTKLRAIGYESVQFSAVGCMDGDAPEVTAPEARAILDSLGMTCCATHRPLDRLIHHTADEIEFHKVLGCTYAGIGGAWSYPNTEEGYRKLLADLAPVVQDLGEAGIRFGYHNHSHEFIKATPELSCLDILINYGGPRFQILVDTYWVQNAGVDPASFLARLSGKVDAVHLKDKEIIDKEGPVMCPVGEGNMDWEAILEACKGSGTQYLIIEQDTCRRDPFDCLRSSFDYVKTLV